MKNEGLVGPAICKCRRLCWSSFRTRPRQLRFLGHVSSCQIAHQRVPEVGVKDRTLARKLEAGKMTATRLISGRPGGGYAVWTWRIRKATQSKAQHRQHSYKIHKLTTVSGLFADISPKQSGFSRLTLSSLLFIFAVAVASAVDLHRAFLSRRHAPTTFGCEVALCGGEGGKRCSQGHVPSYAPSAVQCY